MEISIKTKFAFLNYQVIKFLYNENFAVLSFRMLMCSFNSPQERTVFSCELVNEHMNTRKLSEAKFVLSKILMTWYFKKANIVLVDISILGFERKSHNGGVTETNNKAILNAMRWYKMFKKFGSKNLKFGCFKNGI